MTAQPFTRRSTDRTRPYAALGLGMGAETQRAADHSGWLGRRTDLSAGTLRTQRGALRAAGN